MTANRDRVEHAITETLNGQQLGRPNIQCQLEEMRRADPRNYLDNIRMMEKITSNYKDFPHLELYNAERDAERAERSGRAGQGSPRQMRIEAAPRIPVTREDLPPIHTSSSYRGDSFSYASGGATGSDYQPTGSVYQPTGSWQQSTESDYWRARPNSY